MKRFRIRELIVQFPDPEEPVANMEAVGLCNQVTILECANGVTAMRCANATRLQPQCAQVTFLECATGITHMACDGLTLEQACRRVTFPDCGLTNIGSPAPSTGGCGTKQRVPACCGGCTNNKPCTNTAPTTYEGCGDENHFGNCTPATDDTALFVRTYDVDRMPLESLSVLKSQLSKIMQRAEVAETKFEPQTLEDLDMAEVRLREALEEIQQMKANREQNP